MKSSWIEENWYWAGGWVCGGLTFFGCWIYAIATWGFLLGVAFGWIPAAIIAVIIGFIWPLLAFLVLAAAGALLVFTPEGKALFNRLPNWVSFLFLGTLFGFLIWQWTNELVAWVRKRSTQGSSSS